MDPQNIEIVALSYLKEVWFNNVNKSIYFFFPKSGGHILVNFPNKKIFIYPLRRYKARIFKSSLYMCHIKTIGNGSNYR